MPPEGVEQGTDGLTLPAKEPHVWHRGGNATVAWALHANHGGGYSWRLCKKSDDPTQVTEACFQQTPLRFARDTHRIQYRDMFVSFKSDPIWERQMKLREVEIPMVKVTEGTHPPSSEWARNPIPSCQLCGAKEFAYCGGYEGGNGLPEAAQAGCYAACNGGRLPTCPPGTSMFDPPAFGLASHFMGSYDPIRVQRESLPVNGQLNNMDGFPFSIVDEVIVPDHLEVGDYLLSWRWDTEGTPQIWQNCADVQIIDDADGAERVV